jgi:hypothetical protein
VLRRQPRQWLLTRWGCGCGFKSYLGSQILSLRTQLPLLLTPSAFLRLPWPRQISPILPYISGRSCSPLPSSESRCGWPGESAAAALRLSSPCLRRTPNRGQRGERLGLHFSDFLRMFTAEGDSHSPSATFELLWPMDVNDPDTCKLLRYINLPSQWTTRRLRLRHVPHRGLPVSGNQPQPG